MTDYKKESFIRRMLGEYDVLSTATLHDPHNRQSNRSDKFWEHVRAGLPWCEITFVLRKGVKRIPFHLKAEWKLKDRGPDEWVEWAEVFYGETPKKIIATCGDLGRERELWVWS